MRPILPTYKLSVCNYLGVKLDPERFSMVGYSGAYSLVVGIGGGDFSTSVTNGGFQNPLVLSDGIMLQEDVFCAPEASRGDSRDFEFVCYEGCELNIR